MRNVYQRNLQDQLAGIASMASSSLLPPDNIEVDEWAERHLELSPRVTRFPGPIRFDQTPYTREIMRSFKHTKRTVFVGGAQISKTMTEQCCFGYVIDQDPGSLLWVYPDEKTAKKRSTRHLQPLIQDSPRLRNHIPRGGKLEKLEYVLDRMTVGFAWSGSPSALASEPIRYLIRDEIAKFKGASSKEADALSLSERRTISYGWMARILDATTPTLKNAPGWQDLIDGTYEKDEVPCPYCGKHQVLVFAQFKFPHIEQGEEKTSYRRRVLKETYYECVHCKKKITDKDKPKMLLGGKWLATNPDALYRSFHLASWYAPWVKFGEVAERFIKAQGDIEALRDWLNSDCGEPWEEHGDNADFNLVLAHKGEYKKYTVPTDKPFVLVATVDVQQDHIWYVVRAHAANASYMVDNGTLASHEDVEILRTRTYLDFSNNTHNVAAVFIDSGHLTTTIYEYCGITPRCWPVKGIDKQGSPVRWFKQTYYPGTDRFLANPVNLCSIDTTSFKEEFLITLSKGKTEEGFNIGLATWFLHEETESEYARQLTAEIAVEETDGKGKPHRVWKRIRKDNHYLDCEVYQLAARRILMPDIQALTFRKPQENNTPVVQYDV